MGPEDFLKNYESALATQDWQAVAPFIHQDACVTFSNGLAFFGRTQVQQAFESNFALIQEEQYSITNVFWVKQTNKFAVCLYTFEWRGLINGETAGGSGRGTSVLVNELGKWWLLSEHLGPKAR